MANAEGLTGFGVPVSRWLHWRVTTACTMKGCASIVRNIFILAHNRQLVHPYKKYFFRKVVLIWQKQQN